MKIDRRSLLHSAAVAAGVGAASWATGWQGLGTWAAAQTLTSAPEDVLNPVEVTGPDAVPIIGRLPGARRMYVLPDGKGEYHRVGSFVITRIARPIESGNTYELTTFAGATGATMPRHAHLASHAAIVVMTGDIELELDGKRWRMLRGDFANIPPGTPHGWVMRSDRSRFALFSMGDRAGAAYVAMGAPADSSALPSGDPKPIAPDKLAGAAMAGDFQLTPLMENPGDVVRISNLLLPSTASAYVLLDGGGERYGGNTFCAKDANTNGQFVFIMTEGGQGPGIGAHFHARHTEDFFALDGETMVWAQGKAVPLKSGDFVQAPPRNMHGFKMMQPYNRFVGFLSPGIFENRRPRRRRRLSWRQCPGSAAAWRASAWICPSAGPWQRSQCYVQGADDEWRRTRRISSRRARTHPASSAAGSNLDDWSPVSWRPAIITPSSTRKIAVRRRFGLPRNYS